MLAQRADLFNFPDTAAAWTAAEAAAISGEQIIDLTAGDISSDVAPLVREGAIAAINRRFKRYADTVDLAKLRDALARKLSVETAQPWSADEVAVTSGAKQALYNVAMALLNPGDEVLIPVPYWTNFPVQIALAGGTPVFIDTRHSNYVPKLADLAAAVTFKTKAIVVNTPSNPTGTIYDRVTLAGIAQLAVERDLWIFLTNGMGLSPTPHIPIIRSFRGPASTRAYSNGQFVLQFAGPDWLAHRLSCWSQDRHQRCYDVTKTCHLQSQRHRTACTAPSPGFW